MVSKRLKEEKGMTLSETLVSLLLMSMVTLIIANGVAAFQNVYGKMVMKAESMSLVATLSSAINADLKSAENMTFEDGKLQFFTSGLRGYDIRFVNRKQEDSGEFDAVFIETYQYDATGTKFIPVIPNAAYAKKLSAKIKDGIQKKDHYLEYTIEIYSRTGELLLSQKCDIAIN